ncbi:MAG: hypothetical protein ACE5FH_11485 [Candidatus Zixiibacteriota bacterium]
MNGLLLYAAYGLSSYLNQGSDRVSPIIVGAMIVYFALITVTVLFLGVVIRHLNVYSVFALSVCVAALLIYFFHKFNRPLRPALNRFHRELFSERDWVLTFVVALFVLQVVILLAKVAWLPPKVWDVFCYHLTPAVEWYQQGYIPPEINSPVQRVNSQSLGMTVLSYWYFIFLRDDMLVELPQLLWALLLLPTVYAVLRQSDVEPRWSLKFAILVFFIPIVLMQAVTAKDHLGLNVGFFAALLFMANFLKTGRFNQLILAATAFGLVLGYKLSAPFYPIIAGAVFFVFSWAGNRKLLLEPGQRVIFIRTIAVGVVLMTVIGGYWYGKNLLLYGSPEGVIASKRLDRLGQVKSITKQFQHHRLAANLYDFLPRVFDYKSLYGADLPGMSGFGPQFAVIGLPAILVLIAGVFVRRWRVNILNFYGWSALGLLLVYFLIYYTSNNYRLFSFVAMIMIAYGGFMLHKFGLLTNTGSAGIVNSLIVVSILWCFIQVLPPQYTNPKRLREFISLDAAYRTSANYTRWFIVHRPSFYRLLYAIPASESIAVITKQSMNFPGEVKDDVWSYTYYDRHWQRKLYYLDAGEYLNCGDDHVCNPRPELGRRLSNAGISLVSVCKTNRCVKMKDPDYTELAPGFYYYKGTK